MANEEKIFADGFSFKKRDNAPDFVVGRVSVKVDDAIAFMKKQNKGGWVNLNINQAKQAIKTLLFHRKPSVKALKT